MKDFIERVKMHPCLWKPDFDDYKNHLCKEEAWNEVIKGTDIPSIKAARVAWKKLRDGLRQVLRRKINESTDSSKVWKYERAMSFLVPYMKNCADLSRNPLSMDDDDDSYDEPSVTSIKIKKRKASVLSEEEIDHDYMQTISFDEHTKIGAQGLKTFFESMAAMCESLPEHLQIKVQRAVFNVVMDTREQYLVQRR